MQERKDGRLHFQQSKGSAVIPILDLARMRHCLCRFPTFLPAAELEVTVCYHLCLSLRIYSNLF